MYRAKDPRLGRTIALKVMLDAENADPEDVARFLREARLAAALEHPNVVRILEVGSASGTPYIAMEWIDGTMLGRTRIERPVELLTTIAETLAFAHERGIVHRDLKPGNVMIDRDGRPKLVDFGIAKRVGGKTAFATRDGTVFGTPAYMAPEQELTSAVDARADQFAWAVMAYELLTGERPTRPALMHSALDERRGAVILRALSTAPSERFASMHDLLAAWRPRPIDPPAPPPAAPPPASKTKLFAITTVAVTTVACIALLLALAKSPNVAPPPTIQLASASASPPASASASPSASASASPPPSASSPPARPSKPRRGAAALYGSHEGDPHRDWNALHALVLAVANRCFRSMDVPTGTKVQVDLTFIPSGKVVAVYSEATEATPPALRTCIESGAWKIQFGAGTEGGKIGDGFVIDPRE